LFCFFYFIFTKGFSIIALNFWEIFHSGQKIKIMVTWLPQILAVNNSSFLANRNSGGV